MKHTISMAAFAAALLASSSLVSNSAQARSLEGASWDAKERFMIRARVIDVVPDESSTTSIGGSITAGNRIAPEVDFTYFFTDNIAAELIAATTKHKMGARNTGLGDLDLGTVWALPPTLTLQYHFNPHGQFRPYAGAGLGYVVWYNAKPGQMNSISYDNGISYALQAGMDIGIDDHWALNVDVKKLFHNVDAKVNGGAVTADVDLDPWVIGAGIAYRF
jgi:outer membrane protein